MKSTAVGVTPAPGTCLLCHEVDESVTAQALDAGEYWTCSRCGQTWDASRLDAAHAYALSLLPGGRRSL